MYQVCPACRERPVGIAKPVCLQCWRFVPTAHQKAMHTARRKLLEEPESYSRRLALDAVIREIIKSARDSLESRLEGPS